MYILHDKFLSHAHITYSHTYARLAPNYSSAKLLMNVNKTNYLIKKQHRYVYVYSFYSDSNSNCTVVFVTFCAPADLHIFVLCMCLHLRFFDVFAFACLPLLSLRLRRRLEPNKTKQKIRKKSEVRSQSQHKLSTNSFFQRERESERADLFLPISTVAFISSSSHSIFRSAESK